jgi:hypothetical protein
MSRSRRVISEIIVENPVASVQTGTVSAWIEGLHGNLFVGIGLAYFPVTSHRPASFGANAFSLYQWDENKLAQRTPLSATPINGTSGQAAPDKWEGTTTLPTLELAFTYAGLGAADVGRWEVIVSVFPAVEMCEADFSELANRVAIRVGKIVLS